LFDAAPEMKRRVLGEPGYPAAQAEARRLGRRSLFG
jgi:hypothetical protein